MSEKTWLQTAGHRDKIPCIQILATSLSFTYSNSSFELSSQLFLHPVNGGPKSSFVFAERKPY